MAARLLPCTSLWGTADWVETDPASRRLPEATYLPYSADAPWGLFADGCRLGEGGRDPALGEAEPARPASVEEGPFLFIGPLATHYGHFLVYTLPRLWPLATWQGPLPRLLCNPPRSRPLLEGLEFLNAILARFGLGSSDIVAFDRPVRVRDVIVPEPSLREQDAVHAVFADLCREIGRPFRQGVAVDAVTRPLYLSKTRLTAGVARIANEDAIVEELDRRGVEIAYPETLAFADQVRLFSARRVVMGAVGSAFHTAAFAAPGRRIVGLNWQLALNANFALLDSVNRARARYYHPHGTLYEPAHGWEVSWQVADPRGVATALLEKAERLDRDEPDDEGFVAELRRRGRRAARALRAKT